MAINLIHIHKPKEIYDIKLWCQNNINNPDILFNGVYTINASGFLSKTKIKFKTEEDRAMFILRWE